MNLRWPILLQLAITVILSAVIGAAWERHAAADQQCRDRLERAK